MYGDWKADQVPGMEQTYGIPYCGNEHPFTSIYNSFTYIRLVWCEQKGSRVLTRIVTFTKFVLQMELRIGWLETAARRRRHHQPRRTYIQRFCWQTCIALAKQDATLWGEVDDFEEEAAAWGVGLLLPVGEW